MRVKRFDRRERRINNEGPLKQAVHEHAGMKDETAVVSYRVLRWLVFEIGSVCGGIILHCEISVIYGDVKRLFMESRMTFGFVRLHSIPK